MFEIFWGENVELVVWFGGGGGVVPTSVVRVLDSASDTR
jgi:hypothetical protein